MKLTVSKSELLPILTRCESVSEKKSTFPILANVLLHANGVLKCSATDLMQAVASDVAADIKEKGSIALPARALLERVKLLDGDIQLTVKGSAVTLKSGPRVYKMTGIPGDDFPALPTLSDTGKSIKINSATLLRLLSGTLYAVSTDETRQHMNAALLEVEGGSLRMVATDSHKLAYVDAPGKVDVANCATLIPLSALLEIKRLCETVDDEDVTLTEEGPHLFVDVGGFRFSAKLTGSQFVPYRQVITGKDSGQSALAIRASVIAIIRAVVVSASDLNGAVKLTFGDGKLVAEAESPRTGEGHDECSATYDGPTTTIAASGKYLLETLGALDSESVEFRFVGELDPLYIKPVGAEFDGLAIAMPIRA